ncbi:hypothetical protein BJV82DRAFT_513143 [Fennellomyces sp. T-0311]|nr:hypothetical protein BJV82DRAFT_513143 [Fennellomyces sp. T-0311]
MVQAVILTKDPKPNTPFSIGIEIKDFQPSEPQQDQSVVKILAAAVNHRDIWILKNFYPQEIILGSVLGGDGVGILQTKGSALAEEGQRVIFNPSVNWESNLKGPEGEFRMLGLLPDPGTLAEAITIDSKQVFACPEHLSTAEAAALPIAGLTSYRGLFTKGEVKKGDFVLITGIGGGVALTALQFAVAIGAHVYVTSSSPEKIEFAKKLGAEGGINYKDPNAIDDLKKQLNGHRIDVVLDGFGGEFFPKIAQVMEKGGVIVHYGNVDVASGKGVPFILDLWVNNVELRGMSMGSRFEFGKMVEFVNKYKIKPIVSRTFKGLIKENVEDAISLLVAGKQLGKVVIEI